MSNHSYPRRLLDDAIDRAVHDLVQRDPRPGLRRRVLAQLNAAPARMSWVQKALVPAGALAALLLLALWLRPGVAPIPVTSTAGPVAQAPQQPPVAAAPPQTKTPAGPVRGVTRRLERKREQPVQFTFGTRSQRVVATSVSNPPAVPPAGMDAASMEAIADDVAPALPLIRVAPIEALTPITLKPIEIRPIAIAPQIR